MSREATAHRILAVSAPTDRVLHHIAPLGLAAAASSAVVVDLDPAAPAYPAPSAAELIEEGLRRRHLAPERKGVAVLSSGGVDLESGADLVAVLADGWPAVVVRVPHPDAPWPVVEVKPMLPGPLAPQGGRPAAYQRILPGGPLPGPGLGLPPLRRAVVTSLLSGRVEPRWRWVRAWRRAWELPWR